MFDPMYCPSCKKQVEPTWANCPHCGTGQKAPGSSSVAAPPLPTAAPPSLPPQPVYIVQQVANPQLVIDECTKQYQSLNWIAFAGIFFVSAYLLGLAVIVFAIVQKPNLRRRVAELGVDPEAWEKPLRGQFNRLMLIGCAIVVVMGGAAVLLLPVLFPVRP